MKAALIGYGKMGREIERILLERGHTVPLIVDIDNAADLNAENLRGVDVAIEFTTPDTAFGNIKKCLEAGTPVVCGTTAWLDRYDEAVKICREHNGAFFYASNYSIGVNIFFRINKELARLMNRFADYDVTIEEVHHTQKKDAPSGTAITLAEGILAGLERKEKWTLGTTTAPTELEIGSIRRSVVPGIHTVTYESPVDVLQVEHTIKSRSGLASGAVAAAEFLCGKKGIYTMDDLMKA
jgi:4-hydroxy-tetrahydrodipicolinate reductase